MEPILTTNHLIDSVIAIFLGYMAWQMRGIGSMRTDIAVIKSVVEHLPISTMQSDIQSNRHKIAALDKGLVQVGERLNSLEGKCRIYHGE